MDRFDSLDHGTGTVDTSRKPDVDGIVLAGGASSRLQENKALVEVAGRPLIQWVVDRISAVVAEIVIVTNTPRDFAFLGLPTVEDIYRGIGTLGGLHAGLCAIHAEYGLAVGCDMPFLNPALLRYMIAQSEGYDVVMPRIDGYHEPLHALYARRCLPTIEQSILSGQRRVLLALTGLQIRCITEDEITRHDPGQLSFFNVNTPSDLERMAEILRGKGDLLSADLADTSV